jgi:gentisate 1,2-dioxygenase
VNPLTGGAPMPTIGACMQLLPAGFKGRPHRSTDGAVVSVVEGHGSATIGGRRFEFAPRDTFVVPSWAALVLEAIDDAVLFSFSDRPVLQAIGQLREEFLPE